MSMVLAVVAGVAVFVLLTWAMDDGDGENKETTDDDILE